MEAKLNAEIKAWVGRHGTSKRPTKQQKEGILRFTRYIRAVHTPLKKKDKVHTLGVSATVCTYKNYRDLHLKWGFTEKDGLFMTSSLLLIPMYVLGWEGIMPEPNLDQLMRAYSYLKYELFVPDGTINLMLSYLKEAKDMPLHPPKLTRQLGYYKYSKRADNDDGYGDILNF